MKKFLSALILIITSVVLSGCSSSDIKTGNQSVIQEKNPSQFAVADIDAWTPTFQLCWNELIKLIGMEKIEYVDGNPLLADELNKQKFVKTDLNDKDYYISVTKMTLNNKKKIEKAIKEKFNETSDILGEFSFPNVKDDDTNDWFIYSMLLKNFPFKAAYDVLPSDTFNNVKADKYKYFGFEGYTQNKENEKAAQANSETIFYVNDNDFALKILNKDKTEEMILYLTNSEASFDNIYFELIAKSKKKEEYNKKRVGDLLAKYPKAELAGYKNTYKIPYLHIDKEINFDKELAGKPIKGKTSPWIITKTLQTIKFDLNNEGAKLKSEAAIAISKMALMPEQEKIYLENHFHFDRPFVIFLKEVGKDKPYFVAGIKDGKYLVKE